MPSTEAAPSSTAVELENCPLCESTLDPAHPHECPKCDWVSGYRRQREQPVASGRDIAAVAMSSVPGLGHIYKGHPVMGAAAFLGAVIACIAGAVAATATMGLALLLIPLYWAGVMLHVFLLEDRHAGKSATVGLPQMFQRSNA